VDPPVAPPVSDNAFFLPGGIPSIAASGSRPPRDADSADRLLHAISRRLKAGPPKMLATRAPPRLFRPMSRQIIKYAIDCILVFAPLGGILYFLFEPDAFNAFLDWLVRVL
jgi:hypothetical protein